MDLVIKAENDRRDVRRPSSCNASQLPPFLLVCLQRVAYHTSPPLKAWFY